MRISLESLENEIAAIIGQTSGSIEPDLEIYRAGRAKRALVFFKTAEGGRSDAERLRPVAIALELLELGLRKHFLASPAAAYGSTEANLNLITADYYYARALRLVVELRDDRVVLMLCEGLAEAAEGYAWPDDTGAPRRRDALAKAAHRLGCLMGGHREYKEATLKTMIEEVDSVIFPNPS
jgi:hypothetical protein